ncbi:fructose transport system substrate-binding protein [Rhodovulum iodosum]|uniref:Fructose transport system substrate-binding protein n=1 Tax=Rhodovulum iodosum TaxID=68291 RepID=A0ABV3XR28_9RHOB|nr:sugar ABC transporter substrate-binding protein [Rhodovulum robiginosum]RSK32801.1 sugar ABC transporter substrate-binding protein [Rhodovulum robiginosum]
MTRTIALASTAALALTLGAGGASAQDDVLACLITKTDTNPFFVKMKEGASEKAGELGIELNTYAGKLDGDVETQIAAVESCIAAGASGILITPSDSRALVPVIEQAKDAGLLVIALDTPFEPADAAHATFATDNFKAGELIGQWARATIDDPANAKIALLDLNASEVSVDYLRDQGFMTGFGIDVKDPTDIGDEDDPRIVGHDVTDGNEQGGREAMENLLQVDSGINVVYTINEPAAAGAYAALESFGLADQATIVSVDGGCPGVEDVKAGIIGATSMQFPLRMASLGVEAIAQYAKDGSVPQPTDGLDFFNTGVTLVTDQPVEGLESIGSDEALEQCWG